MNESIQIFGDRGTSRANAIRILNDGFRVSSNDYDWLGEGVYFFQDAPLRASQWAKEQYPEDPVVIRSLIRLENSIDLFDIKWFATLKAETNLSKQNTSETIFRYHPKTQLDPKRIV